MFCQLLHVLGHVLKPGVARWKSNTVEQDGKELLQKRILGFVMNGQFSIT